MEALDVALTVRGSEDSDWYCIERAEHDGTSGIRWSSDGRSGAFWHSGRIGNADIEGTYAEMVEIAKAIKAGGEASFRRCRAVVTADGVLLCSPRNSSDYTLVSLSRALALADEILALRTHESQGPETGETP